MSKSIHISLYIARLRKFLAPILSIMVLSCQSSQYTTHSSDLDKNDTRNVIKAPSFTNLVIVDSLGVTGADGAISFPLDTDTSVFMMGDSFLTPKLNKKRDVHSTMINNTFILINEKKATHIALYDKTKIVPDALLKPTYGNPKEYYWPGHGFQKNGILHIFMSRFLHGDYDWGFKFSGTDYIRIDEKTYNIIAQENFPYSNINHVHYGHSLLVEGNNIYIYGSWSAEGSTAMHVSRAKLDPKKNQMKGFEFFNGKDWVSDPLQSTPMDGIHQAVPEQFSIFKLRNVYVLILQARELGNGNIYSYTANTPWGPWHNEKLLHQTTEQQNTTDQVFTYNAMAHPQYIQDNRLLISYCVNSFDVKKIHEVNTDYYRPQFIWVPLEMILE